MCPNIHIIDIIQMRIYLSIYYIQIYIHMIYGDIVIFSWTAHIAIGSNWLCMSVTWQWEPSLLLLARYLIGKAGSELRHIQNNYKAETFQRFRSFHSTSDCLDMEFGRCFVMASLVNYFRTRTGQGEHPTWAFHLPECCGGWRSRWCRSQEA